MCTRYELMLKNQLTQYNALQELLQSRQNEIIEQQAHYHSQIENLRRALRNEAFIREKVSAESTDKKQSFEQQLLDSRSEIDNVKSQVLNFQ